jgi:hypothetical protein
MAKKRQTFSKMSRDRELKEKREAKAAKREERKRLRAEGIDPLEESLNPDERPSAADSD